MKLIFAVLATVAISIAAYFGFRSKVNRSNDWGRFSGFFAGAIRGTRRYVKDLFTRTSGPDAVAA